jgi:hypothetical protein
VTMAATKALSRQARKLSAQAIDSAHAYLGGGALWPPHEPQPGSATLRSLAVWSSTMAALAATKSSSTTLSPANASRTSSYPIKHRGKRNGDIEAAAGTHPLRVRGANADHDGVCHGSCLLDHRGLAHHRDSLGAGRAVLDWAILGLLGGGGVGGTGSRGQGR